jgi:oligopeptide transport system permease protein
LSKPRVVIKHCMRNAFLPVLSYLGPAAATTLTGSFVVERVFSVQGGLGQQFVDAVTGRDQTMVLGLVLVYSTILLSMNLVVDLMYGVVDPRIELEKKPA